MDFSEELKRWRARMGLTQREAADRLEVKYDTLRDWELGRRSPGNMGPVRKVMALALNEMKQS